MIFIGNYPGIAIQTERKRLNMERKSNVESGVQFLARLRTRPGLQDFENKLFPNGLSNSETVELCGNLSSGKTCLLTQFIAKCILPVSYDDHYVGGFGVNVVFVNTDHHFMIEQLRDFMIHILNRNGLSADNQELIENIVKLAFNSLIIVNCYSNSQYSLTLQTLDNIILRSEGIGLVAIDSIASYYWENRESGGVWSIERYVKSLLRIIQKHTIPSKIPVIYTKLIGNDDGTKGKDTISCANEPTMEMINYRVKLIRSNDGTNFICTVESHERNLELSYTISSNGIEWSERKKRKINEID